MSMLENSKATDIVGSVTLRLPGLKNGDVDAQQWIFERLMPQALELARKRMHACYKRELDEDDVVSEVLSTILVRAAQFRQLENRSDLEQVLHMLVKRRTLDAYRRFCRRQKYEVADPEAGLAEESHLRIGARVAGSASEATQEVLLDLLDSLEHSVRSLGEDPLQVRKILKLRLQRYTVAEIAQSVGRGERAIYRLLRKVEAHFRGNLSE